MSYLSTAGFSRGSIRGHVQVKATATHGGVHSTHASRSGVEGLVRRAKAGDLYAFGRLSELHYDLLLRKTRQITRNREDAEDAVQWTLMRVFTHIHLFDGRSAFSTWVMRIAINAALSILRKRRAQQEIPMEPDWSEDDGWRYEPTSDTCSSPHAICEYQEQERRMAKAISLLQPSLRRVFFLHYVDELPANDIALQLNISVAAVKSRLFRARREVRSRVERLPASCINKSSARSYTGRPAADWRANHRRSVVLCEEPV
jgi:RNA polymerase sigma-70 factor, ECF subfamily